MTWTNPTTDSAHRLRGALSASRRDLRQDAFRNGARGVRARAIAQREAQPERDPIAPREEQRYSVAHGAGLMMQLALNPALGKAEHQAMLVAIANQVLPPHSYVYGEGERLLPAVTKALKALD